jgi:asparagine N-glycosylation enzyme membrane subunit Stt3
MSVSALIILALSGILLLVWGILSIVAVSKMVRFGFLSRPAVISSFAYVTFAAIVLVITAASLRNVDWSQNFSVTTPSITIPGPGSILDGLKQQ